MTETGRPDKHSAVLDALQSLASTVEDEDVTTAIHDDDSAMTPMLVVDFGRMADRADVLRPLFDADGPVTVDSVHAHRAVVRER
jgi:hypothetical protein